MSVADAKPRIPAEPGTGVAASPGAIYTPRFLADWVAERLIDSLPSGAKTVADFACGEGVLLEAVAAGSRRKLELVGADIDRGALRAARLRLPEARFARVDALAASPAGPDALGERLGVARVDGVILNPPWGIAVGAERSQLQDTGFRLAYGQYDSADLFLEIAVGLLGVGGAAALILPDSLFFPDHAPVRRYLLETCTLDLVARLGEGFFPGISRGTVVVVLRRGAAPDGHEVDCVRLTPGQRRQVLAGDVTMGAVTARAAHRVPQERFASATGSSFSIDVREEDILHVHAFHRQPADWTQTLISGRGVELSKHGEIVECQACGLARPRPRRSSPFACACGETLDPGRLSTRKIVRPVRDRRSTAWRPLIAGEDVGRYQCSPRREIQTGIEGINYKAPIDGDEQRLLIRKTGIGLKAAIFEGDALTTQTVFHYQATEETPDFLLHYALGVLSSRAMLAVHLKRTGEIEWRSHPYVTQAILAELPIPQPTPGSQQWKQARVIAEHVSRLGSAGPEDAEDLEVERLVAGLYELDAEDIAWVERVLNEAQGLEGIASLRLVKGTELSPLRVD